MAGELKGTGKMAKRKQTGPGCIGQVMDGRRVVDEVCYCGHSIKDHGKIAGVLPSLGAGQGVCVVCGCPCKRYSWRRFVFAEKQGRGKEGERGD